MMTLKQLGDVLKTTNLPVSQLKFPADKAPEMPFIVYQDAGSDNFSADNIVYVSAMKVQIDLFTVTKDRTKEELLESVLTNAGIFWEREPQPEEDEACYRATYEIEI